MCQPGQNRPGVEPPSGCPTSCTAHFSDFSSLSDGPALGFHLWPWQPPPLPPPSLSPPNLSYLTFPARAHALPHLWLPDTQNKAAGWGCSQTISCAADLISVSHCWAEVKVCYDLKASAIYLKKKNAYHSLELKRPKSTDESWIDRWIESGLKDLF